MKLTDSATIVSGIAAIAVIISSLYGLYKWSFKRGINATARDQSLKSKNKSFDKIYAPLRMELTKTRFIVCTSREYPKQKDRFIHACEEFANRRFLKAKFKAFVKALSDKGESMSVECDTNFPASRIKSIIDKNPQLADNKLINQVHQLEVMVSTPWDHDEDEIIRHQYHLANYIYKKYDALYAELHNK